MSEPEHTSESAKVDPGAWIAANTTGRAPVFLKREIPEGVLKILQQNDLIIALPANVVAIRSPGDDPGTVIRAIVWSVVEKIAESYQPAAVERDSAVRLHLGRTDPGPEIRIRQTSQSRWQREIAPGIVIRIESGPVNSVSTVQIGESRVPVDPPERVLLSLPVNFLKDAQGVRDVSLWLKSLTLSRPAVVQAYREDPRPVVLKRIADMAADVGNGRLAEMLNDIISNEQNVRIGRDRTKVGRDIVVPAALARMPTTHHAWLDRLRLMIIESTSQIQQVVERQDTSIGSPSSLDDLLEEARQAKVYDAYHSSSIEGYRLRLEEVSSLLSGKVGGPKIEDLASRLAVLGYSAAFDRLLERLSETSGNLRLSSQLVLDLYTDLFAPSVEAGLVESESLRSWRTSPVYIRNTIFVPPNPDKVPAMMELLFQQLDEIAIEDGMLRAIMVHLWFVWIHPFPDGNGRVSRFLMNAAFIAAGHPWLTIRLEQRNAYFEALKAAQVEENYTPFARFIISSVTASAPNVA